jgi:hypothetical protein
MAQDFSRRAVNLATASHARERAARFAAKDAAYNAVFDAV